jgi:hypothetical protein
MKTKTNDKHKQRQTTNNKQQTTSNHRTSDRGDTRRLNFHNLPHMTPTSKLKQPQRATRSDIHVHDDTRPKTPRAWSLILIQTKGD